MYLLKKETNIDDIIELFNVKEQLKPLKKKEKLLADKIKRRMKKDNKLIEYSIDQKYYAERSKKTDNEICPADLYNEITSNIDDLIEEKASIYLENNPTFLERLTGLFDLKKKLINDFFNLISVKIKESRAYLSKEQFQELSIESVSYSLSIKKIEEV